MRPESRDAAYLWNMVEAAPSAQGIAVGITYEQFLADPIRLLAMERAIEIIGEAAHRVSPTLKAAHPEIPWQSMVGMRNVIAHQYYGIDHELVWLVATERARALIEQITPLIPPLPPWIEA